MKKEDKILLNEILKEKNKEKKLKELVELYKRNENDITLIFNILKVLGSYKEHRERAKELMKTMEYIYNSSSICFEVGKMETMDENYEKAIKCFKDTLFYHPNSERAKLELARAYKKLDRKNIAMYHLKSLTKNGTDSVAFYELGTLYEDTNNQEEARKCYQKALELKENDVRTLFKIGMLEERSGNIELAKNYFQKAYENNKKDSYILTELSKCERKLGNYETSKQYIEEAIKESPNPVKFLEKGLLYEQIKDYDKAYEIYEQSQNMKEEKSICFRLALLLKQSQYYDKSKEELFKCLKLDNNVIALYMLADIYIKENDIENAQKCLDLIKNHENKSEVDQRNISRIRFYIKSKTGQLENPETYFTYQLLNYDKDKTLEISKDYFKENTNLEEILNHVKDNLTKDNLYNTTSAEDFYIVDLPNFVYGKENIKTKKVMVVTIVNTKNIIAIKPTNHDKIRITNTKLNKINKR